MSVRTKEILVVGAVAAVAIVAYIAKTNGFGGISFSPTVSMIVALAIFAALAVIFVRTILGRLADRRVVFLFVGIAIALPLFMSITQTIRVSPEVEQLYDAVTGLPPGSKVLVSFDYDPPSAPELQPMAESFFHYCLTHDLKLIIMGLWPQGPQQANLALERILEYEDVRAKNPKYGTDYVNLGFQVGNEFVIQRMGSSFKTMFATDYSGNAYDDLPLVRNVKNFSNIDYSFNLSAGYPGTQEWVQVAVDRYGLRLGAGNTAVQAPYMYTFLQAGQLIGLIGGLNGAAEFEYLVGKVGKGTKFMLSQSAAHVVVVAFIIIGNTAYLAGRARRKAPDVKE